MAGAWPRDRGEGLVILKYERQSADEGFDPDGQLVAIDHRRDQALSIYGEYGLSRRLTLQAKAGLTRGHDRFVSYEGRGPVELGLRYGLVRTERSAVSLYLGAAKDGVGRNAGYAPPGKGDTDLEARLLAGTSRTVRGRSYFGEIQIARLRRQGLADETRLDTTVGVRPRKGWLLLAQAYGGQADSHPVKSRWLKSEVSLVREMGDWSVQGGWRWTPTGRETAADHGPVLAVWRRF
ncbi:MAG: hypothetical protein J7521_05220 [Caulobacter sp.]|nr:hypothetical protein [Caulobacter sp.]